MKIKWFIDLLTAHESLAIPDLYIQGKYQQQRRLITTLDTCKMLTCTCKHLTPSFATSNTRHPQMHNPLHPRCEGCRQPPPLPGASPKHTSCFFITLFLTGSSFSRSLFIMIRLLFNPADGPLLQLLHQFWLNTLPGSFWVFKWGSLHSIFQLFSCWYPGHPIKRKCCASLWNSFLGP